MKTMCVGPVALASPVDATATVHWVNLVAMINKCAKPCIGKPCLFDSNSATGESCCGSNRVPLISTVLLENAVILITNVQLLVSENRVYYIDTEFFE